MDDALSLEKTDNGYRLGIHISDVASIIEANSELDIEARERGTSIYCPEESINMLPEELSHDACSLVVGSPRLCLSCLCTLSSSFEVISSEIKPTIINVKKKYSYNKVDKILEQDDGLFFQLYNIAGNVEAKRFANGGSRIPKQIAHPSVDDKGYVTMQDIDENGPARALIGEMMILANTIFAQYAIDNNLPVLFRSQEAPEDQSPIDPSIPDGPAYYYVIKSRLKRSSTSFEPGMHSTLGVNAYLQATSPIRRYLDLAQQRQFLNHLKNSEAFYTKDELQEIHLSLSEPLRRAGALTKDSYRFWLLRWLEQNKRRGTSIKATVLRTDLKNPMVELSELYIPWVIRTKEKLKPGQVVDLKISTLHAWSDYLKFELA